MNIIYKSSDINNDSLLEILKLVLPAPSNDIPKLSILREFIGDSYFET